MTKPCKNSWRATNKDGYHVMNKKKYGYATQHRYVYARYNKIQLKDGDVIRHICDHPWCIEPTHLVLGTQTDNVQDSVTRGRHKNPSFKGSKNPMSRLTKKNVLEIRTLHDLGWSNQYLAKKFDVHRITIHNIINHQSWKEVDNDEG